MNRILLPLTLLLAGLVGCATPPKKIGAQYVSPLVYKDYTNDQIIVEMDHVGQRTAVLYENLKKEANNDKLQTGLGLLVFWPALFLLEGGDGPEAQEYARLKGEYEALRKAAVQRGMNLDQLPPSPEEVLKARKPEKDR